MVDLVWEDIQNNGGDKYANKGEEDWCPRTRINMCKESEQIRLDKEKREKTQGGWEEKEEKKPPSI